jgi:ABC-type phosphate transport system substrate-binding protein
MERTSRKSLRIFFLSFLVIGILSGCRKSGTQTKTPHLTVAVASSLERIAAVVVEEYNKINPQGIPLEVEAVPDSDIRTPLEKGQASAVIQWKEPPSGNWSALIGWTGIIFAVHPNNPVEDLSSAQAQRIYLGWIARWEEIGGLYGDIHILAYGSDTGVEEMLEGIVLKGNRLISGARIVPSFDAMAAAVAGDSQSIGFMLGFHPAAGIRILTIDSVAAEYPNVISGAYPFRIPLYLVSEEEVPAEILHFAGWIQSVAGQTILMEQ